MNPKIQGQIRHLLGMGAAWLVATNKITEADALALVGVGMGVLALIWSWKSPEKKDS